MPRTNEEMLQLEKSLAYNYAFRVIDDNCEQADGLDTYILNSDLQPAPLTPMVFESIEYLRWRGLIIDSEEKNLTLITVQDEDEPISPNESEARR